MSLPGFDIRKTVGVVAHQLRFSLFEADPAVPPSLSPGERERELMPGKEGTWDERWVLYVNDESLKSTPKTNIVLYVN